MKKTLWTGLFFCAVFVVFTGVQSMAESDLPPAEAEPFWTYITETDPYENWDHWPGHDGKYEGTSPHGAYLELYGNDIAIEAAKGGKPMPDGAILVKENYGEDQETLMAITPMYKKKGYNPEAGDWFWAKYGPDGSVDDAGKIDACINCHQTQKDFIYSKAK